MITETQRRRSALREVYAQAPDARREAVVVAGILRKRARVIAVRYVHVPRPDAVHDVRGVERRIRVLPRARERRRVETDAKPMWQTGAQREQPDAGVQGPPEEPPPPPRMAAELAYHAHSPEPGVSPTGAALGVGARWWTGTTTAAAEAIIPTETLTTKACVAYVSSGAKTPYFSRSRLPSFRPAGGHYQRPRVTYAIILQVIKSSIYTRGINKTSVLVVVVGVCAEVLTHSILVPIPAFLCPSTFFFNLLNTR